MAKMKCLSAENHRRNEEATSRKWKYLAAHRRHHLWRMAASASASKWSSSIVIIDISSIWLAHHRLADNLRPAIGIDNHQSSHRDTSKHIEINRNVSIISYINHHQYFGYFSYRRNRHFTPCLKCFICVICKMFLLNRLIVIEMTRYFLKSHLHTSFSSRQNNRKWNVHLKCLREIIEIEEMKKWCLHPYFGIVKMSAAAKRKYRHRVHQCFYDNQ